MASDCNPWFYYRTADNRYFRQSNLRNCIDHRKCAQNRYILIRLHIKNFLPAMDNHLCRFHRLRKISNLNRQEMVYRIGRYLSTSLGLTYHNSAHLSRQNNHSSHYNERLYSYTFYPYIGIYLYRRFSNEKIAMRLSKWSNDNNDCFLFSQKYLESCRIIIKNGWKLIFNCENGYGT